MNKIYTELRKDKAYQKFEGKIFQLKGYYVEDALGKVIPKNIEFMDIDTCGFSFILTGKGDVFSEIIFYKLEDSYILASKDDLFPLFVDIEGDFNIRDVSDELNLIQIEGKNSGEIAQQFYEYEISTLAFKNVTKAVYKDKEFIMARFGYSGEFGYQFILNNNIVEQFINDFLSIVPVYDDFVGDYVKFEVNHPVSYLYNGDANLFELGYAWNIDFTKEEFIGRAAILNKINETTKQSIVFSSLGKVQINESIYFDNKKIGQVYWVRESLDENPKRNYLGMLQVEEYYAHSGLHFVTSEGVEIETLSNPYSIPESW